MLKRLLWLTSEQQLLLCWVTCGLLGMVGSWLLIYGEDSSIDYLMIFLGFGFMFLSLVVPMFLALMFVRFRLQRIEKGLFGEDL